MYDRKCLVDYFWTNFVPEWSRTIHDITQNRDLAQILHNVVQVSNLAQPITEVIFHFDHSVGRGISDGGIQDVAILVMGRNCR